ncbi:MAG: Cna B-type domain-containing protein, partial [Peptococcaceae bacterium]|nr:Cna B-type domain-containing protein [Peptococcaceae bacterium]
MQLKNDVNLWFGMMVEFEFLMPKDGMVNGEPMVFDFLGDDDVFVYIDDVLVLDIGGTHEAQSGTINFATGAADSPKQPNTNLKELFQAAGKDVSGFDGNTFADYTVHTLKFFYLERGGTYSYCKLQFNMPTLPEKSLTVEKQLTVENDDVKDFLEGALDYSFRVIKNDGIVAVPEGTTFVIKQDGQADREGTVGKDGFFTLKAGQKAEFANMAQYVDIAAGETYYVQEVLPQDLRGQYGTIEYVLNGEGGETQTEQNPPEGFEGFLTEQLSAEQTQYVIYRNAVDTNELSFLQITKEIKNPETSAFDVNQVYQMQVKLDGSLLPDGTPYTVDAENKTTENGIVELKAGQTAYIVSGMLSGTTFEVTELTVPNSNVSYRGTIAGENIPAAADKAAGTFTLHSVAKVVVENESTVIHLPVEKVWKDNDNQDGKRPNSITVRLYADGVEVDSKEIKKAFLSNEWNPVVFENLPKYDESGKEIEYTITEDPVEGYTGAISGDTAEGFVITNTHEIEKVSVAGQKSWNDNNNQDGMRPDSITVNLLADGVEVESKVVTANDGWAYSFTNLDKYADGKEIEYTITEDA